MLFLRKEGIPMAGRKPKPTVHIPQELRIRSGGTERHSASN